MPQVEGTIGLMATKDWLSGDENSAAAGNNAKGPRLTPPNILEALEWAEQRQRALTKVRARRQSAEQRLQLEGGSITNRAGAMMPLIFCRRQRAMCRIDFWALWSDV
jgi:hypothetical protein